MALVGFFAIIVALAYFLLVVKSDKLPAPGGTYVEGVVTDSTGALAFNPLLASAMPGTVSQDVSSLVFSGLTKADASGAIQPDIADHWEPSDGGKVWEFHLRHDIRWQDGYPVTSRDVIFTLGLLKSPDFPGSQALANLWKDVEVERLGDYAVRFRLKDAWTPFLNYTTFGLLPQHLLEGKVTAKTLANSNFNLHPIGTGPYKLTPDGPDRSGVKLVQNPLYYSTDKPYLANLWFRFYPSSDAALTALKSNEIDGVSYLDPAEVAQVKADKSLDALSAPFTQNNFLFLNLQGAAVFGTVDVRKALAYAIDRKAIVQQQLNGSGAAVSDSPMLPFSWAYKKDIQVYDYNPELAKSTLDTSGWKVNAQGVRENNGKLLRFSLLVTNSDDQIAIGKQIADNLSAVGVVATLQVAPTFQQFNDLIIKHEYDAVLLGVQGVLNDPDVFQNWHSSEAGVNGLNFSSWRNDAADQLLEKARTSLNEGLRRDYYDQWQKIWAAELPSIPLYYSNYNYAISNRVGGIEPGSLKVINAPSDRFKDIFHRYVLTNTKFNT